MSTIYSFTFKLSLLASIRQKSLKIFQVRAGFATSSNLWRYQTNSIILCTNTAGIFLIFSLFLSTASMRSKSKRSIQFVNLQSMQYSELKRRRSERRFSMICFVVWFLQTNLIRISQHFFVIVRISLEYSSLMDGVEDFLKYMYLMLSCLSSWSCLITDMMSWWPPIAKNAYQKSLMMCVS